MSWMYKERNHSEEYNRYRPTYPSAIYELIADKLEQSFAGLPETGQNSTGEGRWRLAVDVGCGPGKGTLALADYFDIVVGVDSSESQVEEARKNFSGRADAKVSFVCCDATRLSEIFEESSVDLITVAQALHWFDRPRFYEECKKILRPGGLLVAYGYGMHWFEDPEVERAKQELFYPGLLKNMADAAISHLVDRYKKIFIEFKESFSSAERNDSLLMHFDSSLDDYVGYLNTWAIYRKYKDLNPDKEDLMDLIYDRFKQFYPHKSSLVKRKANIFLLFGRKDENGCYIQF